MTDTTTDLAPFTPAPPAGLGSPSERRVSALTWFEGALYLASSARKPEGQARVLRRLPSGDWGVIFESPSQPLGDGTSMFQDYGIAMMAVLQAPGDDAPCLYAGTTSILGGQILRSEDGESFEPVGPRGLGDNSRLSVAGLTLFDGRLFAITRGTTTETAHEERWSPAPLIHVAQPAKKKGAEPEWTPACLPGFGDLNNLEITSLTELEGRLYATTLNPTRGFELWRTEAKGDAPYAWERMLDRGAERFTLNMEVTAAVAWNGALWLGTGLPGDGYDAALDVGPGAAELIRVAPDGTWEIVVGEMRFTPLGLKVPQTAKAAGFHNDFNVAISTLSVHDGRLYAGTRNWEPDHIAGQRVEEGEEPPALTSGAELWATADGQSWTRVEDSIVADPAAAGVTHVAPSEAGLALVLDLSGPAMARKANLWSGFAMTDVQPDNEPTVLLSGVAAPEAPPPLDLTLE